MTAKKTVPLPAAAIRWLKARCSPIEWSYVTLHDNDRDAVLRYVGGLVDAESFHELECLALSREEKDAIEIEKRSIYHGDVPILTGKALVDAIQSNRGWRPMGPTPEEQKELDRQEYIKRTGFVPAPEVELPSEEELRKAGWFS